MIETDEVRFICFRHKALQLTGMIIMMLFHRGVRVAH
jgi:hypothetical protein